MEQCGFLTLLLHLNLILILQNVHLDVKQTGLLANVEQLLLILRIVVVFLEGNLMLGIV
jgi:hypothetical protein